LVPYQRDAIRRELLLFIAWYNQSSHYPFVLCA